MRHHAPLPARSHHPAQAMKYFPQGMLSLRHIFRHQGQVRGHKAPFFIAHIAGVWFSVHTPQCTKSFPDRGGGATRHAWLSLHLPSFFKSSEQTLRKRGVDIFYSREISSALSICSGYALRSVLLCLVSLGPGMSFLATKRNHLASGLTSRVRYTRRIRQVAQVATPMGPDPVALNAAVHSRCQQSLLSVQAFRCPAVPLSPNRAPECH